MTLNTYAASSGELQRAQRWPANTRGTRRPAAFRTIVTFAGTLWVQIGQYTKALVAAGACVAFVITAVIIFTSISFHAYGRMEYRFGFEFVTLF